MMVCSMCIAKFGFKLSDKNKTFETDRELAEHMENVHGIIVIRKGETEKEAEERCAKKGIVSDRNKCQCEECKMLRGEKSSIESLDPVITKKWLEND